MSLYFYFKVNKKKKTIEYKVSEETLKTKEFYKVESNNNDNVFVCYNHTLEKFLFFDSIYFEKFYIDSYFKNRLITFVGEFENRTGYKEGKTSFFEEYNNTFFKFPKSDPKNIHFEELKNQIIGKPNNKKYEKIDSIDKFKEIREIIIKKVCYERELEVKSLFEDILLYNKDQDYIEESYTQLTIDRNFIILDNNTFIGIKNINLIKKKKLEIKFENYLIQFEKVNLLIGDKHFNFILFKKNFNDLFIIINKKNSKIRNI